jgi:phosphoribosylformylglycinamidine synthase
MKEITKDIVKVRIHVTLKEGVLDPQGKAIEHSLQDLGFSGVESVRQGKYIEMELENENKTKLRNDLDEMCRKLLANVVIEDYAIEFAEDE